LADTSARDVALNGLNHKQSESITTKDGNINANSIQTHE
jgi:hypothetical protein